MILDWKALIVTYRDNAVADFCFEISLCGIPRVVEDHPRQLLDAKSRFLIVTNGVSVSLRVLDQIRVVREMIGGVLNCLVAICLAQELRSVDIRFRWIFGRLIICRGEEYS